MKAATMAILALALAQAPAWAVTDVGEFRSEKTGSSATSDQVEFAGPSSQELERTEDEDEVTTYRSTYDPRKNVTDPDDTPEIYSRDEMDSTGTDTSTDRSRAGQQDEGL